MQEKKKKEQRLSLFLSILFRPNLNSGKLARCKGRVRLPARDTNSSGDDDDDDDGAVDALSPSKKRGTKMNTTTSDFQEASKGKIGKMWELFFDTYHSTMIRKKRCVRGWNLSSCCIYTFDQPRSSPSWSNSSLPFLCIKRQIYYIPEATLS